MPSLSLSDSDSDLGVGECASSEILAPNIFKTLGFLSSYEDPILEAMLISPRLKKDRICTQSRSDKDVLSRSARFGPLAGFNYSQGRSLDFCGTHQSDQSWV